jgi:hypothetical protein
MMRRSPGFAAVAVLSLALGIGANTAIFSVIDALMLRALPVRNRNQLIKTVNPGQDHGFSYPEFVKLRALTQLFSGHQQYP